QSNAIAAGTLCGGPLNAGTWALSRIPDQQKPVPVVRVIGSMSTRCTPPPGEKMTVALNARGPSRSLQMNFAAPPVCWRTRWASAMSNGPGPGAPVAEAAERASWCAACALGAGAGADAVSATTALVTGAPLGSGAALGGATGAADGGDSIAWVGLRRLS